MDKPEMNIALLGHVDSGKTSLAGNLIMKYGAFPEDEILKFEEMITRRDLTKVKFLWFCEKMRGHRESASSKTSSVWKYCCEFTKGHVYDFAGSKTTADAMLKTSQNNCAVLVVSAKHGEFENEDNVSQFHEAIFAVLSLGLSYAVAVNKMDGTEPPYCQKRFQEVQTHVTSYLKKLGQNPDSVPIFPVSVVNDAGVTLAGETMTWFKGWSASVGDKVISGATLLDAILQFVPDAAKPLVMDEQEVSQLEKDNAKGGAINDANNDADTDADNRLPEPVPKRTRLFTIEGILSQAMSTMEDTADDADFLFYSRINLEAGILLCGPSGIGEKVSTHLSENCEMKVFQCFGEELTNEKMQLMVDKAEQAAPAIILIKSFEKVSKGLLPVFAKPVKGRLVLFLGTTSQFKDVDDDLLSSFEHLEVMG